MNPVTIPKKIEAPWSVKSIEINSFSGANVVDGYTELPIDADAYKRLESVLETDQAKEILGEPLIDMVHNPNKLVDPPISEVMSPSDQGIYNVLFRT